MKPTRNNYEVESCSTTPLHLINVIQPYGALLVLHPDTHIIIQASANLSNFTGVTGQDVLGKNLATLLTAASAERLEKLLRLKVVGEQLPEELVFENGGDFFPTRVLMHHTPAGAILEIEKLKSEKTPASFASLYKDLKQIMAAINVANTLEEVAQCALGELKRLTGFDRIMMYRFDEDWNGTVIAEVLEEDMEPYLGLCFPGADIPRIARELYIHNPYRHISDRNYVPVKLLPVINPATGAFTDLSRCNLRGVAAVHLEYMANMGVTASMSTRILYQDQLWGLISCHHESARYLSYEELAIFELLSSIVSAKIVSLQKTTDAAQLMELQQVQSIIMEQLLLSRNLQEGLQKEASDLCTLLQVDGVALIRKNTVFKEGLTPTNIQMEELVFWLQLNHTEKAVSWHRLAEAYEPAEDFTDVASGLISLPIRPEEGEYLLGFRAEQLRHVRWGGNPEKAVAFVEGDSQLHPRSSFKSWQQMVQGTAVRWTEPQLLVAERFRNFMQDFLLRQKGRNA
jgi:light-regulated signal transduction histidine kinase (bacteriophytochrome)